MKVTLELHIISSDLNALLTQIQSVAGFKTMKLTSAVHYIVVTTGFS